MEHVAIGHLHAARQSRYDIWHPNFMTLGNFTMSKDTTIWERYADPSKPPFSPCRELWKGYTVDLAKLNHRRSNLKRSKDWICDEGWEVERKIPRQQVENERFSQAIKFHTKSHRSIANEIPPPLNTLKPSFKLIMSYIRSNQIHRSVPCEPTLTSYTPSWRGD